MQITIKSATDNIDYFVYDYLPEYIYLQIINSINSIKLKPFDEYFKLNTRNVILYAIRNLKITKESKRVYNISIDRNLKYKEYNVSSVIKLITYGSRELKGYPIILNTFKFITNNIQGIYVHYSLGL